MAGNRMAPKAPGGKPGRPKGSKNKTTQQIKDMIHEALELGGGTKVFVNFLRDYPVEFMQHLVKPMLPRNVDVGGVIGAPSTLAELVKMQAQTALLEGGEGDCNFNGVDPDDDEE